MVAMLDFGIEFEEIVNFLDVHVDFFLLGTQNFYFSVQMEQAISE